MPASAGDMIRPAPGQGACPDSGTGGYRWSGAAEDAETAKKSVADSATASCAGGSSFRQSRSALVTVLQKDICNEAYSAFYRRNRLLVRTSCHRAGGRHAGGFHRNRRLSHHLILGIPHRWRRGENERVNHGDFAGVPVTTTLRCDTSLSEVVLTDTDDGSWTNLLLEGALTFVEIRTPDRSLFTRENAARFNSESFGYGGSNQPATLGAGRDLSATLRALAVPRGVG